MHRATIALLLATAASIACERPLPLDGRACPCLAGWTCCGAIDVCLPEGAPCPPPDLAPRGPVFEPDPADFGAVSIGQSATTTVELVDDSDTPVSVESLAITGVAASDYALLSDGCSGQLLGAHARCGATVRFAPTAVDRRAATLTATLGPTSVTAALEGVGSPLARLTITVENTTSGHVSAPGLSCVNRTCDGSFPRGTELSLTVVSDPAEELFDGWAPPTGRTFPCAAENPCTVRLDGDTEVTALFHPLHPRLELATTSIDGATGTIDVTPPGTSCGAGCLTFDYGASVRLDAHPTSGFHFAGWADACAGSGRGVACSLSPRAPVTRVSAKFSPANRAFVTALEYPISDIASAIDPQAVANAFCATSARDAGVAGKFTALKFPLSASLASAAGWVRLDGEPFLSKLEQGAWQGVLRPLRLTEIGSELPAGAVALTGRSEDCDGWTGTSGMVTVGDPNAGGLWWLDGGRRACTESAHLYCMEVSYAVTLVHPRAPGRLAFVSNESGFPVAGDDLTVADARCTARGRTLAPTASFKAFLATTTASAASRFNAAGLPWVRVDGIPLVENAADLLSATPRLASAWNLAWDGTYLIDGFALTGAANPVTVGIAGETCGDWSGMSDAHVGRVTRLDGRFFSEATIGCGGSVALYCLEE